MANDEDRMKKVAEASVVLLISRLSGPALLGVCSYIAMSVVNLKTDLAALGAGMNATVVAINKDIDDLQHRVGNIEANYNSSTGNHYGYRSN